MIQGWWSIRKKGLFTNDVSQGRTLSNLLLHCGIPAVKLLYAPVTLLGHSSNTPVTPCNNSLTVPYHSCNPPVTLLYQFCNIPVAVSISCLSLADQGWAGEMCHFLDSWSHRQQHNTLELEQRYNRNNK